MKKEIIAVYGLSTETERLLPQLNNEYDIVGLLDGFRTDGEMYGHRIMPLEEAFSCGVSSIVVVARPGSCKAIAKRIGDACKDQGVRLVDIRGKDLLSVSEPIFDRSVLPFSDEEELLREIEAAKAVSFDLFDTLVMRKIYSYTDLFEVVEKRLQEMGILIEDFVNLRIAAEKELSRKGSAPRLEEIYVEVLKRAQIVSAGEKINAGEEITESLLSRIEFETALSFIVPRTSVCNIAKQLVAEGKPVFITTDTYYCRDKIRRIIDICGLSEVNDVLISCEEGTGKTGKLFDKLLEAVPEVRPEDILHIGDDETADVLPAKRRSISTFKIQSGPDLFEAAGGFGLEPYISTLSDRIKVGFFIAEIFNSPFRAYTVNVGRLFFAPIITDFVFWLRERFRDEEISQALFVARDGFLMKRLYDLLMPDSDSVYFLSSRIAALRAGIEGEEDISYVESMKYFGTPEKARLVRFGVEDYEDIWVHVEHCRKNTLTYIDSLGLQQERTAVFDFVAKGTVQLFLSRLMSQKLKGYYFIQNEPEFMADKDLSIEPFYAENEKSDSRIFDDYYILETVLTSPDPQVLEFDEAGNPVYDKETRTQIDIECILQVQGDIIDYFKQYISFGIHSENKKLDEVFLSLVHKLNIDNPAFLSLKVEDPFFGRSTNLRDIV